MRWICILLLVCVAGVAHAQVTNHQAQARAESIEGTIAEKAKANPLEIKLGLPNEMRRQNVTYGGIIVAAIKADNPLQLLNPVAARRYGAAEDNVISDPISRKPSGLKIFSITF